MIKQIIFKEHYIYYLRVKRAATVTSSGTKPLGLLTFDSDNYFKIQELINTKAQLFEFLKSGCELFKKLEYPFDKILNNKFDFLTIYYRKSKTCTF